MDRDVENALTQYLITGKPDAEQTDENGFQLVSSFWACRREARSLTGRNAEYGTFEDVGKSASWSGAVAYLILLDQIGSAVRRGSVAQPDPSTPDILRAFHNFTNIDGDAADALYSLRCCLAHDFGLINRDKRAGRRERNHIFMLLPDSVVLVRLPADPWDGVSLDRVVQHRTQVGLMGLGQMVEAAAESVLQAHRDGDLDLADGLAADEMNVRFNFQTRL